VSNIDVNALLRSADRPQPNAGSVTYSPRSRLGPRVQFDYQLVAVHAGWVRVTIDDVDRDIPAGHVGLLLPGAIEHFVFGPANQTTHHSWIALPKQDVDRDLEVALLQASPILPLSTAMIACIDAGREVARVEGFSHFAIFAAVARAALLLYIRESQYSSEPAGKRDHIVVAMAQAIIRRRATERFTVKELAVEVGVSPEHLVRLFRVHQGTTPGAVLRKERLARALQLLTRTGLSVTEVAHVAGYASSQHFARSLRQATGRSATELRRGSWSGAD
jgi:AraC-like DNA-binding protein